MYSLNMKKIIVTLATLLCLSQGFEHNYEERMKCVSKDFGYGSFVCVCNTTYCDSLPPIVKPSKGNVLRVTTSKDSKRWFMEELAFDSADDIAEGDPDIGITLNRKIKFQEIMGFGGAFTDSSGINLLSVPDALQDFVLDGYFSTDGLEYNLGRVPIGGTDFSTHPYSYDDLPAGQVDPALQNFSLTEEDTKYKIPYVKKALALSAKRGVTMKLFASPWSGPGWMKDNGKINGDGKLMEQFYPTWATYIIRFLQSYDTYGISFMAITTQNEPTAGLLFNYAFNQMAWVPEKQGMWIAEDLGPQLKNSGFENVTIFIMDDQRAFLPVWPKRLMKQQNASQYVGGIAVHWYWDFIAPTMLLDLTHLAFPKLPILYTEACTGYGFWDYPKVQPGSWRRGESYAKSIIENLQHWVVGWTDWNLALDLGGGPNWAENFVDSPVLVDQKAEEVYRQPMYYVLAHFSKVIPEGSRRIAFKRSGAKENDIEVTALLRPDGTVAVVALNANDYSLSLEIQDGEKIYRMTLEERSIVSLIW